MTAVPAPVIEAEMDDWKAKGGGNSGICGDVNHTYGFHLAANLVSADDYSRWRDPNGSDGPYVDWDYCCAGDFDHKNDPTLRAMHANVLNDLMDGKFPMICEFIGKPWPDKPVYYWARWNGIDTLQKYTGSGHDHWSHISWYRSRVDERAHLWIGDDMALSDADIQKIAEKVWTLDNVPKSPDAPKPPHEDSDYGDPNNPDDGNKHWAAKSYLRRTYEGVDQALMNDDAQNVVLADIQAKVGDSTIVVGAELLKQVMLDPQVVETYAKAIGDQIVGLRYERSE